MATRTPRYPVAVTTCQRTRSTHVESNHLHCRFVVGVGVVVGVVRVGVPHRDTSRGLTSRGASADHARRVCESTCCTVEFSGGGRKGRRHAASTAGRVWQRGGASTQGGVPLVSPAAFLSRSSWERLGICGGHGLSKTDARRSVCIVFSQSFGSWSALEGRGRGGSGRSCLPSKAASPPQPYSV